MPCPDCDGSGYVQYGRTASDEPCGAKYPCSRCDGTSEVVDYDALVFHTRDTVPAPAPEGCEEVAS